MSFLEYIKGVRKGKDARSIELDAMYDPFLEEAIDGYDSVTGNHPERIARMQKKVTARTTSRRYKLMVSLMSGAAVVLVLIYLTVFLNKPTTVTEENLYVYVPENYVARVQTKEDKVKPVVDIDNMDIFSPIEEIEVYVPEEYIVRKQEMKQGEISDESVVITNLQEILTPTEPINIYIPEKYLR